ncbi:MAG: 16S rRNA (guanine(527)-N(7))-methyltransferase RsmG [Lachnospiraceae bacterium]
MSQYKTDRFQQGLEEFGISLNQEQIDHFLSYYEQLIEWNQVMNLTTITEFEDVIVKHFLDSLSIVKVMDMTQDLTLIDVGTGAGFPGIPLKIAFPNLKITLLDSLQKRVKFLTKIIQTLKLEDINAIHGRAEDYAKENEYREQYDVCVSRAVANLTTLSEYCLPFVKTGGNFISYKSEKIKEEAIHAEHGIKKLGGYIENQVELILPDTDIYRNLLVIHKEKNTPAQYPRQAGIPAKEPLS